MRRKPIMLAVLLIVVLAGGAGFALLRGLASKSSVAPASPPVPIVAGTVAPGHRPPSENYALLPEVAGDLRARMAHGRVALLFGSEKTGLSNSDLSHCHAIIGIPTGAVHGRMAGA